MCDGGSVALIVCGVCGLAARYVGVWGQDFTIFFNNPCNATTNRTGLQVLYEPHTHACAPSLVLWDKHTLDRKVSFHVFGNLKQRGCIMHPE